MKKIFELFRSRFCFLKKLLAIPLLLFVSFLFRETLIAQESQYLGFNRMELPPAPQAEKISEYGITPTVMNTGTINITIPIFTVKTGKINLSTKLTYNTGGIKVAQEPGYVGLGWIFNTGGVITRTVRGKADENFGFLISKIPNKNDVDLGFYNPDKIEETFHLIDRNSKGLTDYEPDLFSFNFGNYSGTFYLSQQGIPELYPPQDLQIKPTVSNYEIKGFEITDNKGIKYFFGQFYDDTVNLAKETTVPLMTETGGNTEPLPYTSAWYLIKIIDPLNGVEVNYNYLKHSDVAGGSFINNVVYSESKTWQKDGDNPGGSYYIRTPETTNILTTFTDLLYTNNIEWNGNIINFYYHPTIPNSTLKLDSIVQSNSFDNEKKRIIFKYEPYDSANTNTKIFRLKLDSVVFEGNNTSNKKVYKITYVNLSLPPKDSKSIDHWGYYNGANNSTLLPSVKVEGLNRTSVADRNANESYSFAEIIKSIEYPTGGKTMFDFEANTYMRKKMLEDVTTYSHSTNKAIDSLMDGYGDTLYLDNYFNDTTNGYINYILNGKLDTIPSPEPASGFIKLLKNDTVSAYLTLTSDNLTDNLELNNLDVLNNSYSIVAFLENGLPGQNNTHPKIKGWLTYKSYNKDELNDSIEQVAGGLRVKKVANYDPLTNDTLFNEYEYLKSGYLTSADLPNYATEMSIWHPPCYSPNCPPLSNYYDIVVKVTSSVHNSLGTVSYGKIRKFNGTKNHNIGYIDNYFKVVKDNQVGGPPYFPVLNRSWERAIKNRKVIMKRTQDGYDTVQVNYLQYSIDTSKSSYIKGFKSARIMDIVMLEGTPLHHQFISNQFRYDNYELKIKKYQLKQLKTVDYTNEGKIFHITNYKYDNPFQSDVTSMEVINSKGLTEKTIYKYPSDFLLSCYQPCLSNYTFEESYCGSEIDKCFSDINGCYALRHTCLEASNECYYLWIKFINEHCYHFGSLNINCLSRANKKYPCTENYRQCLNDVGYYNCIDTANCTLSKCYDTAYDNYKFCKQNIRDCAFNKYETETDPFLKSVYLMYLMNVINEPVETLKYIDGELISDTKNEYKIFNDNDTVPLLYNIKTKYDNNSPFVNEITYEKYKNKQPAQVNLRTSFQHNVYLWSVASKKLVAFVKNAQIEKVFYESFEENSNGVTFVKNGINMAKTGIKVLQSNTYTFPADTLAQSSDLLMSYWYYNGYEWNYNVEPFSSQINPPGGNCQYIDEVRVFPKGAEMTTYSYNGFGYLINITDMNGRATYYEYDEYGRLATVRDFNKNIIKHFEYNYSHE